MPRSQGGVSPEDAMWEFAIAWLASVAIMLEAFDRAPLLDVAE